MCAVLHDRLASTAFAPDCIDRLLGARVTSGENIGTVRGELTSARGQQDDGTRIVDDAHDDDIDSCDSRIDRVAVKDVWTRFQASRFTASA